MPAPFAPTTLARRVYTATFTQPSGEQVLVGRRGPNLRNPLYKTQAEQPGSIAPFLKRNMEKALPDRREYVVLPGGATAYTSPEAADWMNPNPYPVIGLVRAAPETGGYQQHRGAEAGGSGPLRPFPTSQAFFGHSRPVSFNTGR